MKYKSFIFDVNDKSIFFPVGTDQCREKASGFKHDVLVGIAIA